MKKKAALGSRKKKKDVDISSDDDDEDEEEEADEEEDVEEDIESDDDDEDDDRRSKFGKSASTNQKGRGKKVATVKESKTASKESSSVRKAPASKSKVVKPAAKVSNSTSLTYINMCTILDDCAILLYFIAFHFILFIPNELRYIITRIEILFFIIPRNRARVKVDSQKMRILDWRVMMMRWLLRVGTIELELLQ